MTLNIFRYEFRTRIPSTIGWIVGIALSAALYLSVYPAFSHDVEQLRKMFANLPPAMHHIMGVGVEDAFGFLAFFGNVFPFITLVGGIMAAVAGFATLTREQRNKTTEFSLTKPRTRARIFFEKLLVVIVQLIVTQLIVFGISLILANMVGAGTFSNHRFMMFWCSFALIQYWLFAFTLLLSQGIKRLHSPVAPALGVSFGLFIIATIGAVIGDEAVRWISPFRFIDYRRIVEQGTIDTPHVIAAIVTIIVCLFASYLIYTRKDVPSVS